MAAISRRLEIGTLLAMFLWTGLVKLAPASEARILGLDTGCSLVDMSVLPTAAHFEARCVVFSAARRLCPKLNLALSDLLISRPKKATDWDVRWSPVIGKAKCSWIRDGLVKSSPTSEPRTTALAETGVFQDFRFWAQVPRGTLRTM